MQTVPTFEQILDLQAKYPCWEMMPGKDRILILEHWARGMDISTSAQLVGVSRMWVSSVRSQFSPSNLESMLTEPVSEGGRPPISKELEKSIVTFVQDLLRANQLVSVRYTARSLRTSVGTVARTLRKAGVKTNGTPIYPKKSALRSCARSEALQHAA